MITEEQFEKVRKASEEVSLEAWGHPSNLIFENGEIYRKSPDSDEKHKTTLEKEEIRIKNLRKHIDWYNELFTVAESFYYISQVAKGYCRDLDFIYEEKVYLPDILTIIKRLNIDHDLYLNDRKKFERNLEIFDFFKSYMEHTLEVYMFDPVDIYGFTQETADEIEDSGYVEHYINDCKYTDDQIKFLLNLNQSRFDRFSSTIVFDQNKKLYMERMEDFQSVIHGDYWEYYTGNCGRDSSGHTLMDLTIDIRYYCQKADKSDGIFLFFK